MMKHHFLNVRMWCPNCQRNVGVNTTLTKTTETFYCEECNSWLKTERCIHPTLSSETTINRFIAEQNKQRSS